MARRGREAQGRSGEETRGRAGLGVAWKRKEPQGTARPQWHGEAWRRGARRGVSRRGETWSGLETQGRSGEARRRGD
jgi:hypothetical protein